MSIKKTGLVMALSAVLLSVNAYAEQSGYDMTETDVVDTKDEAYYIGFQKLEDLKQLSSIELSRELGLYSLRFDEKRSVNFKSGNVTVQEFMNEDGEIMFKGMINVNYSFSSEDDNDNDN